MEKSWYADTMALLNEADHELAEAKAIVNEAMHKQYEAHQKIIKELIRAGETGFLRLDVQMLRRRAYNK